jgi:hypothetical protein
MATTVIYNPKVISSSVVFTGIEARFQFKPNGFDQSLSANFDEGNVGAKVDITNSPAQLVNTPYSFKLTYEAAQGNLTWSVKAPWMASWSVQGGVQETDPFNSIRFNARSMNTTQVVTWSDLAFNAAGISTVGTLASTGTAINAIRNQRLATGPNSPLLSSFDWEMTGTVQTTAIFGSQVKMWIASHNLQLKPGLYDSLPAAAIAPATVSAVPEPSTLALMPLGLLGLVWASRRRGRKA